MRIRKRKVPLPLSLLSPVPLDSNLFSRSPVTVQEQEIDVPPKPVTTSQPSDHLGLTSSEGSASDLRRLILGVGNTDTTAPKQPQLFCFGFSQGDRKQEITDARRGCMGAPSQVDNGNTPLSSEATEWNWGDREREIPLKKRRASISATVVDPTSVAAIKEDRKDENALEEVSKKGSKRRGNTIMEGSRCSRVNGRGWRCCQPTLVGYSLCEHHLGKGRLRSMTTVRGRPSKAAAATAQPQPPPSKPSGVADESVGKRVKLGVVKARSLSSLLGQPPNGNVHNGHLGLGVAHHHHHHHHVEINVINGEINDDNDNAHMVKEEP